MVSDRLVGAPDRADPDAGKELSVHWPGGQLLIGITGLARLEREQVGRRPLFDTREWLVGEFLNTLNADTTMETLLHDVAGRATRRFRRLPTDKPTDKELTIVCAGYKYSEGYAIPGICTISNFAKFDGAPRRWATLS